MQLSWLLVALEYGVGVSAAKAKAIDASSLRLGLGDIRPRCSGPTNLEVIVEWGHRGIKIIE